MTHFDLTPLFRSTVGFDHLSRLMDNAFTEANRESNSYPPYNIEKFSDDAYRITMAVAGFSEDDLDITAQDNALIIKAESKTRKEGDVTYLHRGIAGRAFEQRFHLADHIRVTNAALDNGLLHIELVREVPEHMKPRKIDIKAGSKIGKLLEGKKAKKAA